MITVNINIEDSQAVEKAFYEYNASLNILSYLFKQNNINEEYLEQYIQKSEKYFIILEETKNIVSNKYMPNEDINKKYNYSFDFENHNIIYTERVDN